MTVHKPLQNEQRYVKMNAKRDGKCYECEEEIQEGDPMVWDTKEFKAYCRECGEDL